MPIIKSAIKRAKQTVKRRERNVGIKKDIKAAVKAFSAKPTAETLAAAHSELDMAVKKKLLKKNTVARRKSQLSQQAKEAGVKLSAKKTTAKKPAATKSTAAKKPAAKKATTAKKPTTKATTTAKKAPAKKPAATKSTAAKKPAAKKA